MRKSDPDDYVKNRLKAPKAFFEWCYQSMRTYIWENKSKTIVASNRKHRFVHKKRLTKNSKLTFYDRRDFFMIVLSTSKRIEIQTYEIGSWFTEGIQSFETRLINIEVFSDGQHVKVGETFQENHYQFKLKQITGMFNYHLPDVYANDWVDKLAGTELGYIHLDNNFWPENLGRVYKYRREIEFLQKIHADEMAKQIIFANRDIDMRVITSKWLKRNKVFFRNSTHVFSDYRLKLAIEALGVKMVPGIEDYVSVDDLEQFPTAIGVVKMQNYLIKQQSPFYEYRDYCDMLDELKLPRNKSNLLPKDLSEAHDTLVEQINAKECADVQAEFTERANELHPLEIVIGDYAFIAPKSANDLIREGNLLHHCVGGKGYINKHANGVTTIIFIRDKNAADQSLFTMEYRNHRIVQVQGMRNRVEQPPALKEAVSEWLQIANKTKNKKRQVVAA